jgi:ABC-type lipoprotein export system ATPase subunit
MEALMIKLEDVSKTYWLSRENPVHAVLETQLELAAGEFLVLTGRSGSGKTTLLNLIAGLTRPDTGRVWLDGQDLWALSDAEQSRLRSQKLGFIFQFPSLLPSLTALENVLLPAIYHQRQAGQAETARALELLETVGLADRLNSFPRQLSAGQQQRLVVARALLNRPQLLLADEPTSDLDEQTEAEIMELFAHLHRSLGLSVLLVTHSSALVHYGTRAIQMAGGVLYVRG